MGSTLAQTMEIVRAMPVTCHADAMAKDLLQEIERLQRWELLVREGGDEARDRFVAGTYLEPVVTSWKAKVAELEARLALLDTAAEEATRRGEHIRRLALACEPLRGQLSVIDPGVYAYVPIGEVREIVAVLDELEAAYG